MNDELCDRVRACAIRCGMTEVDDAEGRFAYVKRINDAHGITKTMYSLSIFDNEAIFWVNCLNHSARSRYNESTHTTSLDHAGGVAELLLVLSCMEDDHG